MKGGSIFKHLHRMVIQVLRCCVGHILLTTTSSEDYLTYCTEVTWRSPNKSLQQLRHLNRIRPTALLPLRRKACDCGALVTGRKGLRAAEGNDQTQPISKESESLSKSLHQFDSGKFDVLARHQVHHQVLIKEHDWHRDDAEDILPIPIAIAVVLRIENSKITETVRTFQDEQGLPESRTTFLFFWSKRLETRLALISDCEGLPHHAGLNHSQFMIDHG